MKQINLLVILRYQRSHVRFASFALYVIRCYVHAFLSGLFFLSPIDLIKCF